MVQFLPQDHLLGLSIARPRYQSPRAIFAVGFPRCGNDAPRKAWKTQKQKRVSHASLRAWKSGEKHAGFPHFAQRRRRLIPDTTFKLLPDRGLGQHLLGALLRGVSTREYAEVLPQMAETVGVSRSAISRKAVEASEEQLRQLQERRWENVEILVIYIDGQRFGEHHILSAVGVDGEGRKHILGIELGATENAASVKRLLTHLRDQGLPTDRKYLFVIDGAKALRSAIEEVFGSDQPVQRCRNHKLRNVLDELPQEQRGQPLNLMRAAWRMKSAEEGEKRLEQLARFLERDHESAARSLREGLKEMFTLQRLKIPESLHKCLATTNIIESPQSGVERRTHNVTRWRDAEMVQRWVASAWLLTEKHFRRIDGHANLWALAAILGRETKPTDQPSKEKIA